MTDPHVNERWCSRGQHWVPEADFHSAGKGRKDHYCRPCRAAYGREKYQRYKGRQREAERRRKEERFAAGLCTRCGAERQREDRRMCDDCRRRDTEQHRPYRRHAGPCVLCGFEYADVHHLDGNKGNGDPSNLISLCPNHHRLVTYGLLDLEEEGCA